MEHVVFWSSPSGPAFERVSALAAAVDLVGRLRNDQGVTDAEVHELTAVPLSFRTVVVVEPVVGGEDHQPARSAFAAPAPALPSDEYGEEVAPLGAAVPAVVPDPVGPFKSLAAVEASVDLHEDIELPVPHLVGLPSVVPDVVLDVASAVASESATDEAEPTSLLHAVAELTAELSGLSEPAVDVPDQPTGYELPIEAPVRSLGLFA